MAEVLGVEDWHPARLIPVAGIRGQQEPAIDAAKFAKEQADKLPKPDPREDVNFQRLAGLEQSMLARISPWGR
ncbi:MAG: hypothetical protein H0U05_08705, partial [Actinobacteria bacterium]|nr:hypothetical protein [Actinomycetota bacterium]